MVERPTRDILLLSERYKKRFRRILDNFMLKFLETFVITITRVENL